MLCFGPVCWILRLFLGNSSHLGYFLSQSLHKANSGGQFGHQCQVSSQNEEVLGHVSLDGGERSHSVSKFLGRYESWCECRRTSHTAIFPSIQRLVQLLPT
ncbi:hypothetical protein FOQG_19041 [Fusarium oxysporum f. sp. raphani 54005]|uniref:Secreted protein n=1 Tax=Fusarium oxysporum f. sp. raphani 54005 TaxID=1089458 RepID=X0C097_FUSOX|nr:hypothetical protein FOQG_19041 [Fusarium oxysporum f. sp. raphani 54005]